MCLKLCPANDQLVVTRYNSWDEINTREKRKMLAATDLMLWHKVTTVSGNPPFFFTLFTPDQRAKRKGVIQNYRSFFSLRSNGLAHIVPVPSHPHRGAAWGAHHQAPQRCEYQSCPLQYFCCCGTSRLIYKEVEGELERRGRCWWRRIRGCGTRSPPSPVWHTTSLYHLVHTTALLGAPITKRPNVWRAPHYWNCALLWNRIYNFVRCYTVAYLEDRKFSSPAPLGGFAFIAAWASLLCVYYVWY
ncbi:UPF0451 C17orf61-like protein [Zea mays]|uniref:UPF0451 C17orf61-like protein n=1 Tax=Zea mays TaxID=4577 RepID=A0A1D6KAA3_MAIZE|nr:UPF0451 C17orf61-like protein [Zea mays]